MLEKTITLSGPWIIKVISSLGWVPGSVSTYYLGQYDCR